MNIGLNPSQIAQKIPGLLGGAGSMETPQIKDSTKATGFGDLLLRKFEATQKTESIDMRSGGIAGDLIRQVDSTQKSADATRTAFLAGESGSLHQTMIASQEASISFSLMVEMRNKVMEAYQELMRLQI